MADALDLKRLADECLREILVERVFQEARWEVRHAVRNIFQREKLREFLNK